MNRYERLGQFNSELQCKCAKVNKIKYAQLLQQTLRIHFHTDILRKIAELFGEF